MLQRSILRRPKALLRQVIHLLIFRRLHSNGDIYEGGFKHHKKHGNGTYQWKDGCTREGLYSDDKLVDIIAYYGTDGLGEGTKDEKEHVQEVGEQMDN